MMFDDLGVGKAGRGMAGNGREQGRRKEGIRRETTARRPPGAVTRPVRRGGAGGAYGGLALHKGNMRRIPRRIGGDQGS